ncbi:MAG: transglutaminase domain-containing protein [Candidatus Marinimicrobia bacterium]|nr:transglutaminase domain-containing protein [Candidatus Neomarinimicrobiota bacterium]
MKKIMLLSALFIFACSQNLQRTFNFEYIVNIESSKGKKIELWIPIPQSNSVQTIQDITIESDGLDYSIEEEKVHGNQYLYINHPEGSFDGKTISVSFMTHRIEHQNIEYEGVSFENYLEAYSMVPTGKTFSKVIDDNELSKNNIRGIYDYVLSGMHYGKPKKVGDQYYNDPWLKSDEKYGNKEVSRDDVVSLYQRAKSEGGDYTFGHGNSLYACDIGVGNCTDYHSYFMSLARTLGIPTRFHMGFPIPLENEGTVGGYHCWADYYVEGEGWFPVDISEADKHPQKSNYFFGTVCENRVEMMVGRDFVLEGYSEETVNLFIYPLLEIDDDPSTSFTKHFNYKNI